MHFYEHDLTTTREELRDITALVAADVAASGIADGLCTVFCPHTTAAITINENADPDVQHDFLLGLDAAFPDRSAFRHFEGNSAAHLKSSTVGASETVLVRGGRLVLGKWQGIYFCEFDGPRTRTFHVSVTAGR
ncbi:secondary thiamine-phosphate synthase enzyme YjbQ [Eggerthella sp. YY7918]|uniref:secondary thiamine-phosphate synthase enzyme YjbQ n=1 Tax=Eggerthella sp. (strain YY7918) TaxID=502558 RepID=UPI0002171142|nr:secondary thiamine-phosphate synthase enzyme YjbQ [Eggerthella sp. YY7918]BAK44649.1 uncharacterized ACR [Eggerthella sp. YY7918]